MTIVLLIVGAVGTVIAVISGLLLPDMLAELHRQYRLAPPELDTTGWSIGIVLVAVVLFALAVAGSVFLLSRRSIAMWVPMVAIPAGAIAVVLLLIAAVQADAPLAEVYGLTG